MNHKHDHTTLCLIACILLFPTLVSAQVVRPRDRNAPVTKPSNEPPVRTNPSPELKNIVEADGIREESVTPRENDVVITFRARPSVAPIVEVSNEAPVQGDGGRLDFVNRRTMSKATPAPDRIEIVPNLYTVSFSKLERGTTYYYIVTIPPSDGASTRQYQGTFTTKSSSQELMFQVRYRGFICEEKTDGPGADEIYVMTTVSAEGGLIPDVSVSVHPHVVVDDVESGDVHGDPGRVFHESVAEDILLTVVLMEHDDGNPTESAQKFMTSIKDALAVLAKKHPELNIDGNLSLQRVVKFYSDAVDSVGSALSNDDDEIGTVSRIITADDMKRMGSQDPSTKPKAQGITYDFFTEHRGHGGVYKVYFEIVPK